MWNGVTTLELAKVIEAMIEQKVVGLYHLGNTPKISKFELLTLIQKVYDKKDVQILPEYDFIQDRTIKNTRTDFSYSIPSYKDMLLELKTWMQQK